MVFFFAYFFLNDVEMEKNSQRTDGEHVDFWLVESTTPSYALEAGDFGHIVKYIVPHLAFLGVGVFDGCVADGAEGQFEYWKGCHDEGLVVCF